MKNFKTIIEETLNEKRMTLDQLKKEKELKHKVTLYQAAQYRKGNKISWQDAYDHLVGEIKAAEKAVKKAEAAAKRAAKPKAKRKTGGMTKAKFEKMCKGAGQDFMNDAKSDGLDIDLGDVAWDLARGLMYDPEILEYVKKTIAKNSGRAPEKVRDDDIMQYIADTIYG